MVRLIFLMNYYAKSFLKWGYSVDERTNAE